MKIVFDTSILNYTNAGVARYIKEIIQSFYNLGFYNIKKATNKKHISNNRNIQRILNFIDQLFWYRKGLCKYVKDVECDLLHCPSFAAPHNINKPMVITIHDVYFLRNPKAFHIYHYPLSKYYLKNSINKAEKIICVSNFTKKELLYFYPNVEEKIHVIYEGTSIKSHFSNDKNYPEYNFPFILSVATIEPRKNLVNVIKAFSLIKDKIDHKLILVGGYGWKNKVIYSLVKNLALENRVLFTGFVTDEELAWLYQNTKLFVYIPFYEGFGLPVIEALSMGCKCITSDIGALNEISNNYSERVNPYDVEMISEQILHSLNDDKKNNSDELKQWMTQFTWERAASETLKLYKEIVL